MNDDRVTYTFRRDILSHLEPDLGWCWQVMVDGTKVAEGNSRWNWWANRRLDSAITRATARLARREVAA